MKKGISIRDIMLNQISENSDLNSGLVMFLARRLGCFGTTISVLRVKSAHAMMVRRVYLKRLRKILAGGNIQVPHPIFMNKRADLSQFAKVWRAKMVSKLLPSFEAGNDVTVLQVSPKTINDLFKMFNECVEKRKPFAIKFVGSCSKWIVMNFTFPPEIGSNVMLVTFQMLEDDGFSSNIHSFVLSRTNAPKLGVELKLNGDNCPLMHFFYTDALKIGIYPFNYDKFSVETVTFYKSRETMKKPLLLLDLNNDTGCKRKRFFSEISRESKDSLSKSMKKL